MLDLERKKNEGNEKARESNEEKNIIKMNILTRKRENSLGWVSYCYIDLIFLITEIR